MGLGIRKDDTVYVLAGKEKGKKGRVLAVNRDKNNLLVERINIIKKHMKPNKKYAQGGIIEKESNIHISNVMLLCPRCSKPTKIGVTVIENDKKHRTCKKCKEVID